MPQGYYSFLRMAVYLLTVGFVLGYFIQEKLKSCIASAIIMILWNPFYTIYLSKKTWVVLDIVAIVIELVLCISSYREWKMEEKREIENTSLQEDTK